MLLWLTKHLHPDIANAVREASKVMDGANSAQLNYMLRIVKYMVESKYQKLKLQPNNDQSKKWVMKAFTDSNYSGD